MTYPATEVAKYILNYCTEKDHPISNLKLQKILYFLWIDYYKKDGVELYLDDICAWQLGPVVPDVYYEYCSHAGRPITVKAATGIDDCDRSTLDGIIDNYLYVAASTLVDMTHQTNKPWSVIYKEGVGIRDVIPFSLIISLECCN